jgi:predicted Fe-S protein YdhL (DUF1289 family)
MTDGCASDPAQPTAPESQTPVPSPCTSVCRMDAAGRYCVGCFRTLDEIAGWAGFDDERRRLIWQELRRRRAADAGPCEGRR